MLAAIILAAGESSRMGFPKALLRDAEGRAFVARIVCVLAEAGASAIVVVTGTHHDAIVNALATDDTPSGIRLVRNPDPSRGQLSSLWVGMDAAVGPETEGLLMTLVDVPMIQASTVKAVVNAWRVRRAPIVRPAMGERHGHPVLFDRTVFGDLRRAPEHLGAKAVIRARGDAVLNVPVDDPGCLVDVDTPADYQALRGM